MAATITMALTGSIPKIRGSSTAIPAEAPRPGMTPTTIPTSIPIARYKRWLGDSATESQ
jgi:hypothetical protein